MKRLISIVLLQLCFLTVAFSQFNPPKSIHYKKEHDFMLTVLFNPQFSLYDFITVGINEKNTHLRDEYTYSKSEKVINKCKEFYGDKYNEYTLHATYMKIKASWKVFLEVLNYSIEDMHLAMYTPPSDYILFTTRKIDDCPNPELRHKLSIVPLYLEEY